MKIIGFLPRRLMIASAIGMALGAATAGSTADAASFPDHAITMIVPFPPGGPTDAFARILAQKLGQVTGQAIVVENSGGAGGNIGVAKAAKSAPDGYTILFGTVSVAIAPAVYKSLPYDPVKDLQPVAMVGIIPALLLVQPDAPGTLKGFVDFLHKNPGKYSYATSGFGTFTHLMTVEFNRAANVDTILVPYRGSGPAHQGLYAKLHLYTFEVATSGTSILATGRLKAIGITGTRRSPYLPDVPTFNEAGLKGVDQTAWTMVFVPPGTPAAITNQLNVAINKAMSDPEIKKKLAPLAVEVQTDSKPGPLKAFVAKEVQRWAKLVAISGLKPE
jgi:tripartite-type tricarboxylate transporter receptor subunit TctC